MKTAYLDLSIEWFGEMLKGLKTVNGDLRTFVIDSNALPADTWVISAETRADGNKIRLLLGSVEFDAEPKVLEPPTLRVQYETNA